MDNVPEFGLVGAVLFNGDLRFNGFLGYENAYVFD